MTAHACSLLHFCSSASGSCQVKPSASSQCRSSIAQFWASWRAIVATRPHADCLQCPGVSAEADLGCLDSPWSNDRISAPCKQAASLQAPPANMVQPPAGHDGTETAAQQALGKAHFDALARRVGGSRLGDLLRCTHSDHGHGANVAKCHGKASEGEERLRLAN
jgi:hypothetical protein